MLDRIPTPLKAAIQRPFSSEDHLLIPLDAVLAQLPRGRIKINFGEFRRAAPEDLFSNSCEHDQVPIDLPLNEVVASLGPSRLARRNGQKQIAVPEGIVPLFGSGRRPLSASEPETTPTITSDSIQTNHLSLPLMAVAASWPETVCRELNQIRLETAQIHLPMVELEAALKRGKIIFNWKQVRDWIRPPLPPAKRSALYDTTVELPLGVVAPQFLASRKSAAPRKRHYEIAETMPPLFGSAASGPPLEMSATADLGLAAPSPKQAAAKVDGEANVGRPGEHQAFDSERSKSAPVRALRSQNPPRNERWGLTAAQRDAQLDAASSGTLSDSPSTVQSPALELGRTFGQPGKRSWTVSEIVRHTAQIEGIDGALLVTLDGLLIAAELPPCLAADTMAAFVPQMFLRVTQYSKELAFGEPRHLTVIIEDTPMLIFKSGCVYFAVVGRDRESLPIVQLKAIAAALPRPDLSSQ